MSGMIGHTMYAVLGAKAAAGRRLNIAPLLHRHWASYLAGAYLGCDVQTMPEAVCVDTGKEVGYGTVPLEKSPITGGAVRPFYFTFRNERYRPREIHELFYGRSHVTFGWSRAERDLVPPPDHLSDYCTAVVCDTLELFGPGERPLAYVFGWMTHLVGDALIKSVRPGVILQLLDGKYTPKNRPIQDLFTFHEIGRKELRLNWPALFADISETPVEPVQLHFMRATQPRGRLAKDFPDGWSPQREQLLRAVLQENRRYLRVWKQQELADMELERTVSGWDCQPALRAATGGLSYAQMIETAQKANFRHALSQIAEAIADLFAEVVWRVPALQAIAPHDAPTWPELTARWKT